METMQAMTKSNQGFERSHDPKWCPYLFGTELELLTRPKASMNAMRWSDLVEYLAHESKKEAVPAEVVGNTKQWDFRKWAITEDGSILQNRNTGEMGMELISPICWTMPIGGAKLTPLMARYSSERMWEITTNKVDVIDVGPNYESCGTHVHISAMVTTSSVSQPFEHFKRLARAVVYFERCIDSLMPPHRHKNKWCRSNRYNTKFKALDITQSLAKIDELSEHRDGFEGLAELLCPPLENGNRRSYRWNFMNLIDKNSKRRTVEFRQPPGATTVFRATVWTQFAVAFFTGAVSYNHGIKDKGGPIIHPITDSSEPATFEGLLTLLRIGCMLTNAAELGTLQVLFEGKSKLDDGPWKEETFGLSDVPRIRAKEKNSEIVSNGLEASLEELADNALPFAEGLWEKKSSLA